MAAVKRLLEIGIAVKNARSATGHFSQLFRAPTSDLITENENFAIRFTMCRVGDVDFEIMETSGADGLIQRFIEQRGEGPHHIAFLVEDADALLEELKRRGVPVLSDRPVRLANLKAFFVHPAYFGGILFEFVENLHPWLEGKAYQPDPASPLADGLLDGSTIRGLVAKVSGLEKTAAALKLLGASDFERLGGKDAGQLCCRLGNVAFTLIDQDREFPEGHWLSGRGGIRRIDLEVDNPVLCTARARASEEYHVLPLDNATSVLFSQLFHGTAFGLYPKLHLAV